MKERHPKRNKQPSVPISVQIPSPPDLPNNMSIVWHRGDFSIVDILEKTIIDHYPHGGGKIVEEARDERHQLAEEVIRLLFYRAITLSAEHPDRHYQFSRLDKEDEVEETPNNSPFRLDGERCVKEIEYEGYQYHSDMSEIRRYP